jgi:hypothetical protein
VLHTSSAFRFGVGLDMGVFKFEYVELNRGTQRLLCAEAHRNVATVVYTHVIKVEVGWCN